MSYLWTLADHTPDNLNQIIKKLKEENRYLKEQIKKLEEKIELYLEQRDHRRRASP